MNDPSSPPNISDRIFFGEESTTVSRESFEVLKVLFANMEVVERKGSVTLYKMPSPK
jgi:hypothetical protein